MSLEKLGEGLKALMGDAVRKGKGDFQGILDGLGEAMSTPKTIAVQVLEAGPFNAWLMYTEPRVVVGIHCREGADPLIAAVAVVPGKTPEEVAGDIEQALASETISPPIIPGQ